MMEPLLDAAKDNSVSVEDMRKRARSKFTKFLAVYEANQPNLNDKTIDTLQVEDYTKDMIGCWTTYLKQNCGSFKTATNYFSSMIGIVIESFPTTEFNVFGGTVGAKLSRSITTFYKAQAAKARTPVVGQVSLLQ